MGPHFNKVKCRFAACLCFNESTLQAEQVSSCWCFCAALIMQPRRPRPCSYAHKVNTCSLPQPGNVATSVRPRNSLSNHGQFTTGLQRAWRSRGAALVRLFWGLKSILKKKKGRSSSVRCRQRDKCPDCAPVCRDAVVRETQERVLGICQSAEPEPQTSTEASSLLGTLACLHRHGAF